MQKGVLTIVDLAGKDRMTKYLHEGGKSPFCRDTASLNRDILLLGNVVKSAVAYKSGKPVYVPFRDTKLTRMLSQALMGNERCLLFGCISSVGGVKVEHTLHTLDFCEKSKQLPGMHQSLPRQVN